MCQVFLFLYESPFNWFLGLAQRKNGPDSHLLSFISCTFQKETKNTQINNFLFFLYMAGNLYV